MLLDGSTRALLNLGCGLQTVVLSKLTASGQYNNLHDEFGHKNNRPWY